MRHLGSILLALLAAPLLFVLVGRGLGGLAEVASEASRAPQLGRVDYFAITAAATALGLAGMLFALLAMAPIAPIGPALAGVGFLWIGIWALVAPGELLATVPGHRIGLDDVRLTAAATVSPLLAIPLLVTLFLPGRWRTGTG